MERLNDLSKTFLRDRDGKELARMVGSVKERFDVTTFENLLIIKLLVNFVKKHKKCPVCKARFQTGAAIIWLKEHECSSTP